jgi:hypothetical protein
MWYGGTKPLDARFGSAMTNDDYLRLANHAQAQSDRARDPSHREAWLRVAQGWLSLIRGDTSKFYVVPDAKPDELH